MACWLDNKRLSRTGRKEGRKRRKTCMSHSSAVAWTARIARTGGGGPGTASSLGRPTQSSFWTCSRFYPGQQRLACLLPLPFPSSRAGANLASGVSKVRRTGVPSTAPMPSSVIFSPNGSSFHPDWSVAIRLSIGGANFERDMASCQLLKLLIFLSIGVVDRHRSDQQSFRRGVFNTTV